MCAFLIRTSTHTHTEIPKPPFLSRLRLTHSNHRTPPRSPSRGLRPSNGIPRVLHLSPPRDPTHSLVLKKHPQILQIRSSGSSPLPQIRKSVRVRRRVTGFRGFGSLRLKPVSDRSHVNLPNRWISWRCRFLVEIFVFSLS